MNVNQLIQELKDWRFTRYRLVHFSIALAACVLYETAGLQWYRPYIYQKGIYDFHIADTLGNSLGTIALIFALIGVFTTRPSQRLPLIMIGTLGNIVLELAHPLLGKPADMWDIAATLVAGCVCYLMCMFIAEDIETTS